MFTGLVEELGVVVRTGDVAEGRTIAVRALRVAPQLAQGDSVAINGVCQTVSGQPAEDVFEVVAVGETLLRSTLGSVRSGSRVNLETSLRLGDRLGGHWVQGHVDCTAAVLDLRRQGNDLAVTVELPESLRRYVVEKGSIAVDGVSLTVGRLSAGAFQLHIIPETWERTLIKHYRVGERVNLEADILAKYVENALRARGLGFPGREKAGSVWDRWNREGEDES